MNSDLAIGGGAGLALAVGYAVKMAWDSWQAKRNTDNAAEVTPVANAATANEMALATLEAVGKERDRLEARLDEMDAALTQTREEARKERLKREAQGRRLDEIDKEIGHIKRQFSLAVIYIRSLLSFITERGLADDAPKPPSGLHID